MPGLDKKRAVFRKDSKRACPPEIASSEQSSQLAGTQPDDISDLINALKSKFSKKTTDHQKQLEVEIDQKTSILCQEINDTFEKNEKSM